MHSRLYLSPAVALPEEITGEIVIVGIAVGTVGGVSVAGGVLPVVLKPLVVCSGAAVVVLA